MIPFEQLLRTNRQWRRELRISHARYMIKNGPEEDRPAWKQVLAANYENQPPEKAPNGTSKRRTGYPYGRVTVRN